MSSEQPEEDRSAYGIDWVKTAGGALAAVTAAVLLSTLGAAGTLLGAAVGSIAATVGTSLYSQGLDRSRRAAAAVQSTALTKVSLAQTEMLRAVRREDEGDPDAATAHLEHAEEKLAEARAGLEGDPEDGEPTAAATTTGTDDAGDTADSDDAAPEAATSGSLLSRLRELGWKRTVLPAAGIFLVAVIALTGFELVAGESVSQLTGGTSGGGGTSFGNLTGGDDTGSGSGDDGGAPSDGPTDQQTAPTDDATEAPTDGTTEESEEPTDGTTDESDEPTDPTTAPSTTAPSSSTTR